MRAAERMLCGCCLRKRVLRLCRQAGRAAGNGVGCAGCFYGVLYGQGKKQTFDIDWRHPMRLREMRGIFMPHMCGAYFRPCICAAYTPRGDILCVCEAVYSHCAPPREGKSASGKPAFLSNAAKARKNGSRRGDFRKEQLFCRSDAAGAARTGQIFADSLYAAVCSIACTALKKECRRTGWRIASVQRAGAGEAA